MNKSISPLEKFVSRVTYKSVGGTGIPFLRNAEMNLKNNLTIIFILLLIDEMRK